MLNIRKLFKSSGKDKNDSTTGEKLLKYGPGAEEFLSSIQEERFDDVYFEVSNTFPVCKVSTGILSQSESHPLMTFIFRKLSEGNPEIIRNFITASRSESPDGNMDERMITSQSINESYLEKFINTVNSLLGKGLNRKTPPIPPDSLLDYNETMVLFEHISDFAATRNWNFRKFNVKEDLYRRPVPSYTPPIERKSISSTENNPLVNPDIHRAISEMNEEKVEKDLGPDISFVIAMDDVGVEKEDLESLPIASMPVESNSPTKYFTEWEQFYASLSSNTQGLLKLISRKAPYEELSAYCEEKEIMLDEEIEGMNAMSTAIMGEHLIERNWMEFFVREEVWGEIWGIIQRK